MILIFLISICMGFSIGGIIYSKGKKDIFALIICLIAMILCLKSFS